MESLQGYFLISTPRMGDPRFQERVVYLCAHSDEGAMGLIINQPVDNISVADILQSINIEIPEAGEWPPVYIGGPVDMESAFILYTSEYEATHRMQVSETISLSSDPRILEDIVRGRGPKHYLFVLGYSGWAPGQLENELATNGWLTLPGEDDVVFHTPDGSKWKRAAQIHGIDITMFGDEIGTA
jgi:putative transcriptional regulator